jgi:hypothetical protein
MPCPLDSRSAGISNGMSIPQNRESREWYSAEGLLFRRQIEERNGLTIDSCEFLQFDVVDTAFAQFALGDERSALAHFRANLTLTQASLFARLFQSTAKILVSFLILTISWVHTTRYIHLLTNSPQWGIMPSKGIPKKGTCQKRVRSWAGVAGQKAGWAILDSAK